jgi:hypothetical protein
MDRGKLLGDLEALGARLVAGKDTSAVDLAAGMGMALLALAELLKLETQAEPQSGPAASTGFKAKSSRW